MTHYEALGIVPDAAQEDIKSVYRRLASLWHPDRFTELNEKEHAEAKMAAINAAYDVLSDPAKRKEYDETGGNAPDKKAKQQEFLHRLFFQLLTQLEGAGNTATVIDAMRAYLVDEQLRAAKQIGDLATTIRRRKALHKRITRKEGENILAAFLARNIEQLELQAVVTIKASEELGQMLPALDGYEITAEPGDAYTTAFLDQLYGHRQLGGL